MPPASVGALTLAWADIRSLPRSGFGLGVAAVLTSLLALLMSFALYGTEAMRDALMFLAVVPQFAVGILVAARIASARRTRSVESLYTTPLEARTWFAAQALVGLFLAAVVVAVHLPFIAVFTAFVGPPHMLGPVLATAGLVGACAVAAGLFFGVVVGQAGPAAAAGLTGGFGFLSFFALIIHGISAGPAPLTTLQVFLVRVTSLSPLALAVDATGVDIFGVNVDHVWQPFLGLAAQAAGFAGAAWLAYTRFQGPLGWEPRPGRWLVAAVVAVAVVVPVGAAATSFHEVESYGEFIVDPGEHTRIALVAAGSPITDERFAPESIYQYSSLPHGEDSELDALVMVLAPGREQVRSVSIQVKGSPEIAIVAGGWRSAPDGQPDGQAAPAWTGDTEPRPVYRVPVTVRPLDATSLLESPSVLEVHTTFRAGGQPFESHGRMTLHSTVEGASWAMLAAGAPVPLLALGALAARRLRTR